MKVLFAYDEGATDSGVRDERLRARRVAEWRDLPDEEREQRFAAYVDDAYLSPESRALGYSDEDADAFREWLAAQ